MTWRECYRLLYDDVAFGVVEASLKVRIALAVRMLVEGR